MSISKTGHFGATAGHGTAGHSAGHSPDAYERARTHAAKLKGISCPVRVNLGHGTFGKAGHITAGQDMSALKAATSHPTAAPGNWMHIAAANLVADHQAGRQVDPVKLETARRLLEGEGRRPSGGKQDGSATRARFPGAQR